MNLTINIAKIKLKILFVCVVFSLITLSTLNTYATTPPYGISLGEEYTYKINRANFLLKVNGTLLTNYTSLILEGKNVTIVVDEISSYTGESFFVSFDEVLVINSQNTVDNSKIIQAETFLDQWLKDILDYGELAYYYFSSNHGIDFYDFDYDYIPAYEIEERFSSLPFAATTNKTFYENLYDTLSFMSEVYPVASSHSTRLDTYTINCSFGVDEYSNDTGVDYSRTGFYDYYSQIRTDIGLVEIYDLRFYTKIIKNNASVEIDIDYGLKWYEDYVKVKVTSYFISLPFTFGLLIVLVLQKRKRSKEEFN